jgi:hypothetical protein
MFQRKLQVERIDAEGVAHAVPIAHLDSFSMRNFTNDAIFDDTLPVGDGLLEAGKRVPSELLREKMQDWFRRKSYLAAGESLRVSELERPGTEALAMSPHWPNLPRKI